MIKKISLILLTLLCVSSAAQPRLSPLSSALVFPAAHVSYSARDGYREYDGFGKYEHIPHEDIFMFGGAAGMRFAIKRAPRLRVQTAAEIWWGKCENGSFTAAYDEWTTTNVTEYLNLMTFGGLAYLHVLFPSAANQRRAYFLSIGPGLHRSSIHYTLKAHGAGESDPGDKVHSVSVSGNIGAGMEHRLLSQRGISVAYNLRIWEPVRYMEFGQLFPMGADYREVFITHSLQIALLLPRLRY